ncbi:MAG TPA: hypothetical protein VJX92_27275 [Methylomirabilota bacterium]|nr:hypothetical protein [Methylomirabilota bacterium]
MRHHVLGEGILVGLAGAVIVAIWFLIFDLAAGVPLRTPALLGAVLFQHLHEPAALEITPKLVLEYTIVHGTVFVVFGIVASSLFALVDRDRRILFAVFMLFACFEVAFLAAVAILSGWLYGELRPWSILSANALAAVTMLAILFRRHHRSPAELLVAGE